MNNDILPVLRQIVATYGQSICDDPRRVEALLKDLAAQHRREIVVLMGAVREGVPGELLTAAGAVPGTIVGARLSRLLQDNLSLAEEAAQWAVEAWATALDIPDLSADSPGSAQATSERRTAQRLSAADAARGRLSRLSRSSSPSVPAGTAGRPIWVGKSPRAIAITPDGRTAYVVCRSQVVPLSLATGDVARSIEVGADAWRIAIAPDGRMAYVAHGRGQVTSIDLSDHRIGRIISVDCGFITAMAITPDGSTLLFSSSGQSLYSMALPAKSSSRPRLIQLAEETAGFKSWSMAVTPDGRRLFVARNSYPSYECEIVPVILSIGTAEASFVVGLGTGDLAITPDGSHFLVANSKESTVALISVRNRKMEGPIVTGNEPFAVAIAPDGTAAYVANRGDDTVTPVRLSDGACGAPIKVGSKPAAVAITPTGRMAYVVNMGGETVTPIQLS